VALADDLERIAATARSYADGTELTGVLVTEALPGARVYLCAFRGRDEAHAWLALDDDGEPVRARRDVRDAISIAALRGRGGRLRGDLDELRSQLVALGSGGAEDRRGRGRPRAPDRARVAAAGRALARSTRSARPRGASRAGLDSTAPSPFTDVLARQGRSRTRWRDVEAGYLQPLEEIV
jgi:hypothetical protein